MQFLFLVLFVALVVLFASVAIPAFAAGYISKLRSSRSRREPRVDDLLRAGLYTGGFAAAALLGMVLYEVFWAEVPPQPGVPNIHFGGLFLVPIGIVAAIVAMTWIPYAAAWRTVGMAATMRVTIAMLMALFIVVAAAIFAEWRDRPRPIGAISHSSTSSIAEMNRGRTGWRSDIESGEVKEKRSKGVK